MHNLTRLNYAPVERTSSTDGCLARAISHPQRPSARRDTGAQDDHTVTWLRFCSVPPSPLLRASIDWWKKPVFPVGDLRSSRYVRYGDWTIRICLTGQPAQGFLKPLAGC